ncbi:DevC protein [Gloeomargarita lithophora Alchichica-D10]|uniref:DevC protein n=1 Tax=Gloeomargarita lithophora Alchichica-D10 TaxID=1188229 RepID=A0A1J0AC34_9CYAN|nr:ABC transporter permease DevC [Gloeomargarita lithophora]APB33479.1 DevC protein [Gloeomargarita lithophora Alchichica-D10]
MTVTLPKQKPIRSAPHKLGFWQNFRERTPLGWLQLRKNKGRLFVAVAGIGFADLLMFAQLGIQAALFESNTLLIQNLNADIILRSSQYRDLSLANTFPRRRLYQIQDVPGVAIADALYINNVVWKNPETRRKTQLTLVGQEVNQQVFDLPGLDLTTLKQLTQPDTFLFDRLARGQYANVVAQVAQGKTVSAEIDRRSIQVVGLFPLGASFATDGTLITSQENFLRFFPNRGAGQVTLGLIDLEPEANIDQVLHQIQAKLPLDTLATTKQEFLNLEQAYWAETTPIGLLFGFGTAMAFVVGIVIVFQILSTDVNDHLAEYATFKAMGYGNRYLFFIVIEEAMILALLGFVPGLALALGQYALIRSAASLPIGMTFARFWFVFFLTLVMCMTSGMIALRKVQAADPADIF